MGELFDWYMVSLKNFTNFSGRARRMEYWSFVLVNMIIAFCVSLLGSTDLDSLYSLFVLLPSIAVTVRRLHDTGRSGWNYLFMLIPIVGWIILLIMLIDEGDEGSNEYGSAPKRYGIDSAADFADSMI